MIRSPKKWSGILDRIGNTPLIKIERMNPNPKVTLLAKLESRNPGGSVKDRIALAMIEAAEKSGELKPGKIILEATSGNTGIGIAMVGAVKGYRVELVMSEGVSIERRKILSALGAGFILTPAEAGTDGAIEVAYELGTREKEKYCLVDQYNNPANVLAHYNGTAMEIWNDTDGKITHFVAAMGTTGTLMGVSKRLHELNPAVKIIGVEPYLGHRIQGLKNMKEAYRPGIYERNLLDSKVNVSDEAAFETAREIARKEGLLVGMSSGAAMFAAMELVKSLEEGLVVVLFPDGGERYLSTPLFVVPEEGVKDEIKKTGLRFFNTLTHRYEPFEPIVQGEVKIYSCGPTVDSPLHIGDLRRMVTADLLKRWLEFKGMKTIHVVNITDIDDRTIGESERQGIELSDLTRRMENLFFEDLEKINVKKADKYPRASENVDEMVTLVQKLLESKYAYEKLKNVYFDISRKKDYGKLSGFDIGKIKSGDTTDNDSYEKDNPADFTLFKRSTLAEIKKGIFYKTPWGNVRPGWHIECAAMATKYLGTVFDIHTSSVDLIFPHHENEIAICEAINGKTPAKYWLHSETVLIDGKKMSRQAGNTVGLQEIIDRGYSPRMLRYALLAVHYRQPFNFSFSILDSAKASLQRIDTFLTRVKQFIETGHPSNNNEIFRRYVEELLRDFNNSLDDDLNTSATFASLFTFIRRINALIDRDGMGKDDAKRILDLFTLFDKVLGVLIQEESKCGEDVDFDEVKKLIEEREEARRIKDWEKADAIRLQLLEKGVIIEDTLGGPRWRKKL